MHVGKRSHSLVRQGLAFMAVACIGGTCRAESVCYRSVAEAMSREGSADGKGYQVEWVRVDALSNAQWASVLHCGHPEWPRLLIRVPGFSAPVKALNQAGQPADAGHRGTVPVVFAGRPVRLLQAEANVRLQMRGISQANGALGEHVRVRMLLESGEERFVNGIARGDGLVEMDQR